MAHPQEARRGRSPCLPALARGRNPQRQAEGDRLPRRHRRAGAARATGSRRYGCGTGREPLGGVDAGHLSSVGGAACPRRRVARADARAPGARSCARARACCRRGERVPVPSHGCSDATGGEPARLCVSVYAGCHVMASMPAPRRSARAAGVSAHCAGAGRCRARTRPRQGSGYRHAAAARERAWHGRSAEFHAARLRHATQSVGTGTAAGDPIGRGVPLSRRARCRRPFEPVVSLHRDGPLARRRQGADCHVPELGLCRPWR